MPELPEVETIRRGLRTTLLKTAGKVRKITVFEGKSFIGEPKTLLGT